MTYAICIKCGAAKHGCWTPCEKCRHQPFGISEAAYSLLLSDHQMTNEGLEDISTFIKENGRLPTFAGEADAAFRRCEETVRGSARGLAKKGLLPMEEAPDAAAPLLASTVNISLSPRARDAIEDFCLDQNPPAKPETVIEWIVEDWLEREGYFH